MKGTPNTGCSVSHTYAQVAKASHLFSAPSLKIVNDGKLDAFVNISDSEGNRKPPSFPCESRSEDEAF